MLSVIIASTLSTAFDLLQVRAQESPIEVWSDYTLDRDITFVGDGFIVKADNVTLDLNGHTITEGGEGIGVNLTEVNGVTVKNGEISNFSFGIYLRDAGNHTITGNTLTKNSYGI